MKSYTIQTLHVGICLALLLVLAVLTISIFPLLPYGWGSHKLAFLAVALLALVLFHVLTKKLAVRRYHVVVADDMLQIRAGETAPARRVPLSEVVSFGYNAFSGTNRLRLQLHSGEKIVFRHNEHFCAADDLEKLVADLEARAFQAPDSGTRLSPAMKRETPFFEKPIATVVGIGFAIVLFYLSWKAFGPDSNSRKSGSLFTLYGFGLAYVGAWLNARRKNTAG
ncbi:hypothetical protein LGH70_18230 [Hymenobacter sp. BT635]|uniref:PH domain-containing protein n=1 Tax=Hymenobacter nitidus TaxID=2880929 RepID=A0ABS8AGH7_9BACT|nr:hypothetical protein [Hymenobacter nitidus]MCB2379541.1 hypothetical protein [Hymenobacter nitidus]